MFCLFFILISFRVPDSSARKRGLVGPYVKTIRTVWKDYADHQLLLLSYWFFFNKIDGNHKDTVICQKYWEMLKKKSLYNPPKPYFISVIYGLSLQYGKLASFEFLCFLSVYNWAIVAIWSLLFVNKYSPLVGVY